MKEKEIIRKTSLFDQRWIKGLNLIFDAGRNICHFGYGHESPYNMIGKSTKEIGEEFSDQ